MKQLRFILLLSIILLCSCEQKKDAIEIEKEAFNSIFEKAVDSIYFKLDSAKIIKKNQSKIIVINDSIRKFGMPNASQICRHFKNINQVYVDTIFENNENKIELSTFNKGHFTYVFRSKLPYSFEKISWQNYSFPGILTFTKMHFDKELKVGVLGVTYGTGNIWTSKEFYIYIKKTNENWIIDQVYLRNLIY